MGLGCKEVLCLVLHRFGVGWRKKWDYERDRWRTETFQGRCKIGDAFSLPRSNGCLRLSSQRAKSAPDRAPPHCLANHSHKHKVYPYQLHRSPTPSCDISPIPPPPNIPFSSGRRCGTSFQLENRPIRILVLVTLHIYWLE